MTIIHTERPHERELLTVIVPVYNVEAHLRRCLDSIIHQTYRNLEIICINDGSTDGSAAILAEYACADARIRVIHQENAGLSAARNTGIRLAHGELLTTVDSDDYLEQDAYSRTVPLMTEDVNMICFSAQVEGPPGSITDEMQAYMNLQHEGIQIVTPELAYRMPDTAWNKIFRRSVILEHGIRFAEGLWYEDFGFKYMYLSVSQRVLMYPARLYHYVLRDDSIMGKTQKGNSKVWDRFRILDTYYTFLTQHGLWQKKKDFVASTLPVILYTIETVPHEMRTNAREHAKALVAKWDLHRLYPKTWYIKDLMQPKLWVIFKRLFHKKKETKESFLLFGLPILVIQMKNDKIVWRCLGLVIWDAPSKGKHSS